MFRLYLLLLLFFSSNYVFSQNYWQQAVDYKMFVDVDVKTFKYKGSQRLIYTNNSPDTINKVFYHMFFNAFKPGSEMATRVKTGKDINVRFQYMPSIDSLKENEQGYIKSLKLKQDGILLSPVDSETILEVPLNTAILPGGKTVLTMDFIGQLPKVINRAGRESDEGVAISMSQWYPKLAEYDYDGWNAEPYLGREFHGVWGDFDVTIKIDKEYTVAASGYLQNPENFGHGYGGVQKNTLGKKISWRFIAPSVHDFTWAADPDYIHDTFPGPNNVTLRFFYKNNPDIIENWKRLQPKTADFMRFFNNTIGAYPYKEYNVVQGGEGGMEYAMLTLISGERSFRSLAGVTAHELAHSWFQHVLATNELKHEWMDEGFTSYISTIAEDIILEENASFPLISSYNRYFQLATSGKEQPQSTNSNRYDYNFGYEATAYSKGAVFLAQLGYIIGPENLAKTIKNYYSLHKFRHPTPNDFRRVAESVSGIQLKWYITDWTQTTNTIDYAIRAVNEVNDKTLVVLERIGSTPMPLDVLVTFKDGSQEMHYIPIALMRGEKKNPYQGLRWVVEKDWAWAFPNYSLTINKNKSEISKIVIDPSFYMADIERGNNNYSANKR